VGFLDLELKPYYDSESDDILRQFYIPVLSRARTYYRLAGFFSSDALAVAAKGMSVFIRNQGNMKLIVGARLQKHDVEAIREGKEDPEKVISEMMLEDLKQIEDEIVRDHVRALAWLVAKNQLDLKVAIVIDKYGLPMDYETAVKRGIFHQKVGVFEDEAGNLISFSGSVNESAAAWEDNIEEFKVFRSWVNAELSYLASDKDKFEKYWNGQTERLRVVDVPTAVRERLVELAPQNIESLKIDRVYERPKLRDYQDEAVTKWLENSNRGIFEMATATGKTYAALECLRRILDREKRLVAVIACPYNHLIVQWTREIERFGISCDELVADSSNPRWKDELTDQLMDIRNGIREKLIVLTTHATFSTDDFMMIIEKVVGKLCLIVDEVHGIGAPERKRGLIDNYEFRLGLSATPKRWFDFEGTEELFDFFGDVVFEFNLRQAIEKGILSPYEYKPYFTELTAEEMEDYEKETARIAKAYYASKDQREKEELFSLLCFKRQNIIKNAANKYNVLADILADLSEIRYCLIYCTPRQIDRIQDILNEKGIIQHRFTQNEGLRPEKKYGGISERQFLLQKFAEGNYQALVSMKCLDEGVDIPPARTAIMMENSGNPREYIQRRGRILRTSPEKKKATIFDIIVVPTFYLTADVESVELEKKIMAKELKRYKEFAHTASNTVECLKKIEWIEDKYGIIV